MLRLSRELGHLVYCGFDYAYISFALIFLPFISIGN